MDQYPNSIDEPSNCPETLLFTSFHDFQLFDHAILHEHTSGCMPELVIYSSAAGPTKCNMFTARRTTCRDGQAAVERQRGQLPCVILARAARLTVELGFGLQLLGMQCSSSYAIMHKTPYQLSHSKSIKKVIASLLSRHNKSVKNLCTVADASMRKIQLEARFPSLSTPEILLQSTQGNSRQPFSHHDGGGCARSTGYSTTFLSFALIQSVARLFALRLALDHADTDVALGGHTGDRLDLLAL
jgi:hypothetical protein